MFSSLSFKSHLFPSASLYSFFHQFMHSRGHILDTAKLEVWTQFVGVADILRVGLRGIKIVRHGSDNGNATWTLLVTKFIRSSSSSNMCADNWEDVCDEICRSNIIQRDNQKFARKLNKNLVKLAKERAVLVRCQFNVNELKRLINNCRHKMTTICGRKERAEKWFLPSSVNGWRAPLKRQRWRSSCPHWTVPAGLMLN